MQKKSLAINRRFFVVVTPADRIRANLQRRLDSVVASLKALRKVNLDRVTKKARRAPLLASRFVLQNGLNSLAA